MRVLTIVLGVLLMLGCGSQSGDANANSDATDSGPKAKLVEELQTLSTQAAFSLGPASRNSHAAQDSPASLEGREEMLALARAFAIEFPSSPQPQTAEEFFADMRAAKSSREAELTRPEEDLRSEIASSDRFALRYGRLTRFASITVLGHQDGIPQADTLKLAQLRGAMERRVRLLVRLNELDRAAQELQNHLTVIRRMNGSDGQFARALHVSMLSSVIRDLVAGQLRPLLNNPQVAERIWSFNDPLGSGRKLAWQAEFAGLAGNGKRDLSGLDSATLKRLVDELKFHLHVAREFDSAAPDIVNTSDYSSVREIAGELGLPDAQRNVERIANAELQFRCHWAALHLMRVEWTHPGEADKVMAEFPGVVIVHGSRSVQIGVDPVHPSSIDCDRTDFYPLITLR